MNSFSLKKSDIRFVTISLILFLTSLTLNTLFPSIFGKQTDDYIGELSTRIGENIYSSDILNQSNYLFVFSKATLPNVQDLARSDNAEGMNERVEGTI